LAAVTPNCDPRTQAPAPLLLAFSCFTEARGAHGMKILLVEDNSDDAEFLRACLAHYNRSATLTRAGL